MSAKASSVVLSRGSAARLSVSSTTQSPGFSWGRFALFGVGTIAAATLANTLFYYVASALVTYDPEFIILATPGGTIVMTVAPAIVAVLLYAALLRFTRHAAWIFSIVAAIVLVVSFVPDFTYVPTVPGSSNPQVAMLLAMHVIAAAVIVRMLTGIRRHG